MDATLETVEPLTILRVTPAIRRALQQRWVPGPEDGYTAIPRDWYDPTASYREQAAS